MHLTSLSLRFALVSSLGLAAACQLASGLSSLETGDWYSGAADAATDAPSGDASKASDASDASDAAPVVYASCKDAKASGLTADGEVSVDADGSGPLKPFSVYCFGMSSASPKEYLTLKHTIDTNEPKANVSTMPFETIGCGYGTCPLPMGTDIKRYYTKVRLDLTTLGVDSSDMQFSKYADDKVAACWASIGGGCTVFSTYLFWGRAAGCSPYTSTANVDLRDTGFAFDSSVDVGTAPWLDGPSVVGTQAFNADRTVLDLTEKNGACGWEALTGGYTPAYTTDAGAMVPQYKSLLLTRLKQL